MKYRIRILGPLMYRDGRHEIHAGIYRVPEDLSEEVAQRALKREAAVKVTPKVAPENKVVAPPEPGSDPSDAPGRPSPSSGQGQPSSSSGAGRRSRQSRSSTRGGEPE